MHRITLLAVLSVTALMWSGSVIAEPRGPYTPVNFSMETPAPWSSLTTMANPRFKLILPKEPAAKRIQFAAQCGSSKVYCDKPGATYCCGTGPSNYYCAKDVNGCTR